MTFILLSAGSLFLASTVALISAIKKAPMGYEDELGFHEGVATPAPAMAHGVNRKAVRRNLAPRAIA